MKDRIERDYDVAIQLIKDIGEHSPWVVQAIEARVAQLEQQAEVEAYRNRGVKPWTRHRLEKLSKLGPQLNL